MRKILTGLAVACALVALPALGQSDDVVGNEVLTCSVVAVRGNIGSFLPPRVGSRIGIDLATPEFERLTFRDGAVLTFPEVGAISRTLPDDPWRGHQVFFLGASPDQGVRFQLIVGAYSNGAGTPKQWLAKVQSLHSPLIGEWALAELDLTCQIVR